MNKMDIVKLSRLKKIVECLEAFYKDEKDADVSFEFLIGSCFPNCYDNVQKEIRRQYTLGYLEGIKHNESEYKD